MDDIDRAKDLEMRQRDIAIKSALNRPGQPSQQCDDDGHVICIDCAELIPQGRLDAFPTAARCVECKAAYENHHNDIMGR